MKGQISLTMAESDYEWRLRVSLKNAIPPISLCLITHLALIITMFQILIIHHLVLDVDKLRGNGFKVFYSSSSKTLIVAEPFLTFLWRSTVYVRVYIIGYFPSMQSSSILIDMLSPEYNALFGLETTLQ